MNQPDKAQEAWEVLNFLEKLRDDPRNGSAAMAFFKRGLSKRAVDIEKMQRYLNRFMSEGGNRYERQHEESIFLIASLFALYKDSPATGKPKNMGDHFAEARDKPNASPEAIERRFSALLGAHHQDLNVYLRRAITFLKAQDVGINWAQLLEDVWNWSNPYYGEQARREWSRHFWAQKSKDKTEEPTIIQEA